MITGKQLMVCRLCAMDGTRLDTEINGTDLSDVYWLVMLDELVDLTDEGVEEFHQAVRSKVRENEFFKLFEEHLPYGYHMDVQCITADENNVAFLEW